MASLSDFMETNELAPVLIDGWRIEVAEDWCQDVDGDEYLCPVWEVFRPDGAFVRRCNSRDEAIKFVHGPRGADR